MIAKLVYFFGYKAAWKDLQSLFTIGSLNSIYPNWNPVLFDNYLYKNRSGGPNEVLVIASIIQVFFIEYWSGYHELIPKLLDYSITIRNYDFIRALLSYPAPFTRHFNLIDYSDEYLNPNMEKITQNSLFPSKNDPYLSKLIRLKPNYLRHPYVIAVDCLTIQFINDNCDAMIKELYNILNANSK